VGVVAVVMASSLTGMVNAGAAKTPNTSLVFYRTTPTPRGAGATLADGVYSPTGTYNFSDGWTQIAISRDSILFYDYYTGFTATGTYRDGLFTQMHTYQLSAGWTRVTASCDTVLFLDSAHKQIAWGTLTKGTFAQTGSGTVPFQYTDAYASCDSLMLYKYSNGLTMTTTLRGGVLGPRSKRFVLRGKLLYAVTDDSFYGYNTTEKYAFVGTFTAGHYVTKRYDLTLPFVPTELAGTSDTILAYSYGSNTGEIATVKNGVYQDVGALPDLSPNWSTIEGGK
jgi:hypothetical protein